MTKIEHADLLNETVDQVRAAIRRGAYDGQTAGLASGRLQANLAILGDGFADDFHEFCERNDRPCPLVGVSGRGDPMMSSLGDVDIRSDVPSYNVYRHGDLAGATPDIADLWTDDMVAFALGCSFTFERALREAGVRMRHIEENRTVSMYRTNLPLTPVGPFAGEMVVSMRPIRRDQVDLAVDITSRYPHAHGAPVHVGRPEAIGVAEIGAPDWGEPTPFEPDEEPVFWACGVTPQNVLRDARPPICITHTPGRMLVTDRDEMAPPRAA